MQNAPSARKLAPNRTFPLNHKNSHHYSLHLTLCRGADLVPGVRKSIENEEIPKGAARVLNAAKIQQEFAEKKRKQRDEADGAGPSRKKQKGGAGGQNEGANALRIKPGESIGHFNRCVYRCFLGAPFGLNSSIGGWRTRCGIR